MWTSTSTAESFAPDKKCRRVRHSSSPTPHSTQVNQVNEEEAQQGGWMNVWAACGIWWSLGAYLFTCDAGRFFYWFVLTAFLVLATLRYSSQWITSFLAISGVFKFFILQS